MPAQRPFEQVKLGPKQADLGADVLVYRLARQNCNARQRFVRLAAIDQNALHPIAEGTRRNSKADAPDAGLVFDRIAGYVLQHPVPMGDPQTRRVFGCAIGPSNQ